MKTDRQALIELQHSKPIDQVIRDALENTRGKKSQIALVAVDLGVTDATIYKWCEDLGINIEDYRRPIRGVSPPRFPLDPEDGAGAC